MKGFDAFAGVIKSGGKTRRAAKMVILNAEHPDIVEFINCKVEEEKKAWALIDAGYDGSFTGVAYGSVFFQNSNNSVRVTDDFMRAVLDDGEWHTRSVTTGDIVDTYRARDIMRQIAEGTWVCGDPGMQFDTTVNDWHTCPNTSRINASNPCSEYMFLDDSACNLASINLMKFVEATASSTRWVLRRRAARSSRRRKFSSTTRAIRRRRLRRTATTIVRSASAMRIWARCSCRAACRMTAMAAVTTRRRSRRSCTARRMRRARAWPAITAARSPASSATASR
jgi:ribonucleotide reductase alpha subunit